MDLDALEMTTFGNIGVGTEFHLSRLGLLRDLDRPYPGPERFVKTSARKYRSLSTDTDYQVGRVTARVWVDPLQ